MAATLAQTLQDFYASRDLSGKPLRSACYAPYAAMYFDVFGNVTACCQSKSYPLGNITKQSLEEIWRGPRARAMRAALARDNFKLGCDFCQWQFAGGNSAGAFIKTFDDLPVLGAEPDFPTQMDFSIGNACNLECVMCNGEWSSAIRSRREKLPPLPKVYGEKFFDELRAFLPHVRRARFYGGEPFLQPECFRIWELMVELGYQGEMWVTTNGTQYNDRVARILEQLPFNFSVSMDGATRATVENIRRNARYDDVVRNVNRFVAYTRRRGTLFGLAYCLMRQNWHEFGDFLLVADERDAKVFVNIVDQPSDFSLYTLSRSELSDVVAAMEQQEQTLLPRLGRNRQVWLDELDRLRRHAAQPVQWPLFEVVPITYFPSSVNRAAVDWMAHQNFYLAARRQMEQCLGGAPRERLVYSRDGQVVAAGSSEVFLGRSLTHLVGWSSEDVDRAIARNHGERRSAKELWERYGMSLREIELRSPEEVRTRFLLFAVPLVDRQGHFAGNVNYRIEFSAELDIGAFIECVIGLSGARVADYFGDANEMECPRGMRARAREKVRQWAGNSPAEMVCDRADNVLDVGGKLETFVGPPPRQFIGQPLGIPLYHLLSRCGPNFRICRTRMGGWFVDWLCVLRGPNRRDTHMRVVAIPRHGPAGELIGTEIFAAISRNFKDAPCQSRTGILGTAGSWQVRAPISGKSQ